jgi:two-component system, LytTR family, sensor kinase
MSRWRLSSRELVLIFIFWTSLATVTAVNRLLDPRAFGFRVMSPAGPIALVYLEAWIWAAFTPFVFWLSSRVSLEHPRWYIHIPLLIVIGIAISVSIYFLLDLARAEVFENAPRRGVSAGAFAPWREIGRFRFLNQLLVYLAVLAAGFAREYFVRDQGRQRQAVELQAQLADARLNALRMQINPHFLFNTLHAISALVDRDPAGVRRMIARLSELLRMTIDRRAADEVPLREELAFLRRYIEIMEIRFQGTLRVSTTIDNDTLDALVPNLILQPIVENALEHGVSRRNGAGEVEIGSRRDGEHLVLRVRDNGPGLGEGERDGGVGLSNTRARLAQLYGDEASLTLRPANGGGVVAEMTLPFHTTDDLRAPERIDA